MFNAELQTILDMEDSLWQQFLQSRKKNRLGHALLIIGSPLIHIERVASRMIATLLCKALDAPCGQCQSCLLVTKNEHPDWHCLRPEKEGAVIKIEQIRQLQITTQLSPQLGNCRVVMMSPAEKLNSAAANALLKMLEEPTGNLFYFLIAEHTSTIPVTILSRCQQWRCASKAYLSADYLSQLAHYSPETTRGILLASVDQFLEQLTALCGHRLNVHALALSWSQHHFPDIIWILYLIHAQLIQIKLGQSDVTWPHSSRMLALAEKIKLTRLYSQLDILHGIIRKLNHTFSMNQLLVLESFLIGYLCDDQRSQDD